jgi:hypothetical protein
MTESVTFAQLDSVLAQLGFRKSIVAKSHVAYRHDASDTVLLFPPQRAGDAVSAGLMVGTRKVLLDRGLVEAERLDEMLHATAA